MLFLCYFITLYSIIMLFLKLSHCILIVFIQLTCHMIEIFSGEWFWHSIASYEVFHVGKQDWNGMGIQHSLTLICN